MGSRSEKHIFAAGLIKSPEMAPPQSPSPEGGSAPGSSAPDASAPTGGSPAAGRPPGHSGGMPVLPAPAAPEAGHAKTSLTTLALGALGVVFGDIGTSPLYAVQTCFARGADGNPEPHAVPVAPETVLGVLSLVFWSLTVVVAVKYIGFIMRADNKGEGGIFALLALVPHEQLEARAAAT